MSLSLLQKSLDVFENKDGTRVAATPAKKNKKYIHKETPLRKKTVQDIQKDMIANSKKMDLNLKRLLALSQNTLKSKDAEKILKRTCKQREKVKKSTAKEEQKSIFTEKDFADFEREYFNTNNNS